MSDIADIAERLPRDDRPLTRRHICVLRESLLHVEPAADLIGEPCVVHCVVSLRVHRNAELLHRVGERALNVLAVNLILVYKL